MHVQVGRFFVCDSPQIISHWWDWHILSHETCSEPADRRNNWRYELGEIDLEISLVRKNFDRFVCLIPM